MELKMKCFQANENEITFVLCGLRLPQKSRKAHKSSTIEIVNSGILSDRCHCQTANIGWRVWVTECMSLYVDEFRVREMFLFSGSLFWFFFSSHSSMSSPSSLLLLHVVYAYWTIADSRDFNRSPLSRSRHHSMMCDFFFSSYFGVQSRLHAHTKPNR